MAKRVRPEGSHMRGLKFIFSATVGGLIAHEAIEKVLGKAQNNNPFGPSPFNRYNLQYKEDDYG